MRGRCRLGFDEETKRRLMADYASAAGGRQAGELPVRPPCRRREHWWHVAAQAALPRRAPTKAARELATSTEPLRSRSLRLAKNISITLKTPQCV